MQTFNLDALVEKIYTEVQSHKLEGGGYARRGLNHETGERDRKVNEYGCADAANILYTIGRLPQYGDPDRDALISTLLSFQKEDGRFEDGSHHAMHTTAFCLAALDLFDAVPNRGKLIDYLAPYRSIEGLTNLLESLNWKGGPWGESHKGVGVFVAMNLTRAADMEWNDAYFKWLWENVDARYGVSREVGYLKGDPGNLPDETNDTCAPGEASNVFAHFYGWFHYTFNMEWAHMPMRYPDKIIDTGLYLFSRRDKNALKENFGHGIDYKEIDWLYMMNRATRQTAHRYDEVKQAMVDLACEYIPFLESVDTEHDGRFSDLHQLCGSVCALAELQAALPGVIRTTVPLRLVLDRRPFI